MIRTARAVLVCCFLLTVASACGGLDPAVEQSVVFAAVRPGGFVFEDPELSTWAIGVRDLTDPLVAAAAWHSLLGHVGDWSVGPELVVSSRLDLARAAEIVASGEADRDDLEQIESLLFEQDSVGLDASAIAQRTTVRTPAVEAYLQLRSQPLSSAAQGRHPVYVQNEKMPVQRIVVVDTGGLADVDFDELPGQFSSVDYQIAGDDRIETLTASDCTRLVSEHPRS